MSETILAWQFVHAGNRVRGGLVANWDGVRAAALPLDALELAGGPVVVRVRLSGEITHDAEAIRSRHREMLWEADAGRVLREFAIWCAERALTGCRERGDEPHVASRRALEVTRHWLDGNATDRELAAARRAAWDAVYDAGNGFAENGFVGNADLSAARSAAGAADIDAARAAGYAAATVALSVGWAAGMASNEDAAEEAAENAELERRLLALAPTPPVGVAT